MSPTHGQIALHLGRVEDVHRPALVEGHVIGDIDQGIDRAKADCLQALLHPGGARAVLHAAHQAQRKAGAQALVIEINGDGDRRFALDREAGQLRGLQRAETGSGEITGNAIDARAIGAVRRQVNLDHRIVETGIGGKRGSDRRILGQVDDAVMAVGNVEFLLGTHHAVAFHAADIADGQRHIDTGHIGAGTRQRADEAGAGIGRTADDLHGFSVAGIDHQHF